MAPLLLLLVLILDVVLAVCLDRKVFIVVLARSVNVTWHATDMTALLLIFEARLAMAFGVFALDYLEHSLRFSRGDLAVFSDDPLLKPRHKCPGIEPLY